MAGISYVKLSTAFISLLNNLLPSCFCLRTQLKQTEGNLWKRKYTKQLQNGGDTKQIDNSMPVHLYNGDDGLNKKSFSVHFV